MPLSIKNISSTTNVPKESRQDGVNRAWNCIGCVRENAALRKIIRSFDEDIGGLGEHSPARFATIRRGECENKSVSFETRIQIRRGAREISSRTLGLYFLRRFAQPVSRNLLPIESTPCRPRRVRLEPELLDETRPCLA